MPRLRPASKTIIEAFSAHMRDTIYKIMGIRAYNIPYGLKQDIFANENQTMKLLLTQQPTVIHKIEPEIPPGG